MTYFSIYQDSNGRYRWRLFAVNGDMIAVSAAGYASLEDCDNAIRLVMAEASRAQMLQTL